MERIEHDVASEIFEMAGDCTEIEGRLHALDDGFGATMRAYAAAVTGSNARIACGACWP